MGREYTRRGPERCVTLEAGCGSLLGSCQTWESSWVHRRWSFLPSDERGGTLPFWPTPGSLHFLHFHPKRCRLERSMHFSRPLLQGGERDPWEPGASSCPDSFPSVPHPQSSVPQSAPERAARARCPCRGWTTKSGPSRAHRDRAVTTLGPGSMWDETCFDGNDLAGSSRGGTQSLPVLLSLETAHIYLKNLIKLLTSQTGLGQVDKCGWSF